MKFKTIVVTRKKIIISMLCILFVIVFAVIIRAFTNRTVSVFGNKTDTYEDILTEGLPNQSEEGFSIKDSVKKIFGFDVSEPETIIGEYSPIFERTTSPPETPPTITEEENVDENIENNESVETENETPDDQTYTPPMPNKAQISKSVGLKMNNATDYKVDANVLCGEDISLTAKEGEPQVLVVHTHTTECFDGDQMNDETERNTDESVNIVAVGNEICRVLEENGIKTVHDTTYHDYPSYQGSYTRALSTIETQLKNNPSIDIVLDVHRDAFIYADGSKLKVSSEQNGISAAQVMIVVGTNSMGLWHDNWKENLKFAAKIQNAAEIMYPGIMRPIDLRTERFNEHMTKGSLILEVGSNGNTLAQAKEGGKYIAQAIASVLKAK